MIYRETGDFKTTYAEDLQIFPVKLDRIAFWALMAVAFLVVLRHQRLLGERGSSAVPDLCHRGDRAEHPDGLLRAGLSSARGVHGGGAPMPATS
jgi:hypothetical protein